MTDMLRGNSESRAGKPGRALLTQSAPRCAPPPACRVSEGGGGEHKRLDADWVNCVGRGGEGRGVACD